MWEKVWKGVAEPVRPEWGEVDGDRGELEGELEGEPGTFRGGNAGGERDGILLGPLPLID